MCIIVTFTEKIDSNVCLKQCKPVKHRVVPHCTGKVVEVGKDSMVPFEGIKPRGTQ